MIPIVDGSLQVQDGVKGNTVNSKTAQLCHIANGIGCNAAHIIIHDAHIHALCRFPCHDLHHGVPHLAVLQNEVFRINEFFRLFQGIQHIRKHGISQCVICNALTGYCRKAALPLHPTESLRQTGIPFLHAAQRFGRLCLHMRLLQTLTDRFPAPLVAETQIQHRPRNRHGQNDHQPQCPIGALFPAGKDVHFQYHRKNGQHNAEPGGIRCKQTERQIKPDSLNCSGRQHRQYPANHFFQNAIPFFCCQILIFRI